MEYVCLDLEGVLVPEIWSEIASFTGEDKFNLTTQDVRDYSELMDMRIELIHELNISVDDINQLVRKMEPFSGAKEFLDWLRGNYQMTIVSDSFYQLAWPLIQKLGTPPIICHRLEIAENKINDKYFYLRISAQSSYVILPNGITKKIGFLKNPVIPVNSRIIVNRKVEKEKKERRPFMEGFNETFSLIASTLMAILLAQRL